MKWDPAHKGDICRYFYSCCSTVYAYDYERGECSLSPQEFKRRSTLEYKKYDASYDPKHIQVPGTWYIKAEVLL